MSSRIVWFVAGSAAGVYAAAKARRAAYRLSTPGVADQAAALGLGWRELRSEIRDGMLVREQHIARRLAEHATQSPMGLDEFPYDPTPPDKKAP